MKRQAHEATPPAAKISREAASPAAAGQVEFRVVLRGVKLDPSTEKAFGQELRIAVLQQLSQLEHDEELHATAFGEQPEARPLVSKTSRLLGTIVTSTEAS
ncbi:hypothetical protein [Archangium lansingense]|uniref:Uncharacterized protein n=1 Tax=Archangium lansingense TaxID=2995310 RepID=A0ABT4ABZ7_9BACT|nr:hypothetical protein [Archangium lansinium]MCY1079150.1 hypothetical protein [Archangium lansinium]